MFFYSSMSAVNVFFVVILYSCVSSIFLECGGNQLLL